MWKRSQNSNDVYNLLCVIIFCCETLHRIRASQDFVVQVVEHEHASLHSSFASERIFKRSSNSFSGSQVDCSEQDGLLNMQRSTSNYGNALSSVQFPLPDSATHDMISLIWTGEKNSTLLVALSNQLAEVSSSLYICSDGKNYTNVTELSGMKVSIVEKNPTNSLHVIVIGTLGDSYQACVSVNGAKSFHCSSILNDTSAPSSRPYFMGSNVFMMLQSVEYFAFASSSVLAVSTDSGITWYKVAEDVEQPLWHPTKPNIIYILKSSPSLGLWDFLDSPQTYLKTIDITDPSNPIESFIEGLMRTQVSGFNYMGSLLHVVVLDDQHDGQKVHMVSSDDGKTFNNTHLPIAASGQVISILDMSQDVVFAHVSTPADSYVGKLYTSGAGGLMYSLSLDNHVFNDFYPVQSISGVYLTTQKLADESLLTLISYNRGAEWGPIQISGCDKDPCLLQVIGTYLIQSHKASTMELLAQKPYSSVSAPGIIIVQGFVADKIQYDTQKKHYVYGDPKLFVSGDGGYNWLQTDVAQGHHVEILDRGGILLALPINGTLSQIKYSVDEGNCWHSYDLQPSINVKGLFSQPGQRALSVGIVGYSGSALSTKWTVVTVNFTDIIGKQCDRATDLVLWSEHDKCYLGELRTFVRVKASSWCYAGEDFNIGISNIKTCSCSKLDYECDYGYSRSEAGMDCQKDKTFDGKEITFCLDNLLHILVSSGYRLIPGDRCNATIQGAFNEATLRTIKQLPAHCNESDPGSIFPLETIQQKICDKPAGSLSSSHAPNLVPAVVILSLLLAAVSVAFGFVFCRYRQLIARFSLESFDGLHSVPIASMGHLSLQADTSREEQRFAESLNTRNYSRLQNDNDVELLA